ncbi:MAG: hypothetical protein JJV98_04230 [Desulfosarcina sp.]|nr:hypothetical protein [Desulfobacterales bacterium]
MKKESDQGYAAKHDASVAVDADLSRALESAIKNGGLRCQTAHAIARRQNKSPLEAGTAADLLNVRIVRCQLGLFGYLPRKRIVKPAETVDPALAAEIRAALENGRLPCKTAWAIADRRQLPRLAVAETCEALKIKMCDCQLGAF